MSKETSFKIKSALIVSVITGVIFVHYKNRKEKIKCIMGVEKGFAKTKKELEQLGLNPESVSEFLNYTFKSLKTLKKEVKLLNEKTYTKENIENILIKSFNISKENAESIIENYNILEIFEDNIDALNYLIDTLEEENLNKDEFKKLILELYKDINK